MDPFEKQQRVDSVRGIVKARWINIALIIALGFALKTKYSAGGEWASGFEYFKMLIMGVFAFGYNFAYWLFIRRPIEKIGQRSLAIVAALQVIVDQLMYTLIVYYSGTVETIAPVLYFITILIASSLYKTRGIILAGLLAILLHNSLYIMELEGLIPHITAYKETVWFGNIFVSRGRMTGFTFYIGVAVVFSIILSDLFKKRIKTLREQGGKLIQQSQVLLKQTQELTQTKDWLHEALVKSDKARVELQKTKEELEKANLELKAKIEELEKYGRVTVGREIKMSELKQKIKTLEERMKELEGDKS